MSDLTARIVEAHAAVTDGRTYGGGPGQVNCSTCLLGVLARVYGEAIRREQLALVVGDPARPWSPVEACVRLGIGVEAVEGQPHPGRWHVVQGWRVLVDEDGRTVVPREGPRPNGHSFLWWEPAAPGPGRRLDANLSRPWDRAMTWGEARGAYSAGVRVAVLG